MLLPEYWPQDARAMYGDNESESLCQQFGIDSRDKGISGKLRRTHPIGL